MGQKENRFNYFEYRKIGDKQKMDIKKIAFFEKMALDSFVPVSNSINVLVHNSRYINELARPKWVAMSQMVALLFI